MPQFKRFVAYLYYYENDTKEYLADVYKRQEISCYADIPMFQNARNMKTLSI